MENGKWKVENDQQSSVTCHCGGSDFEQRHKVFYRKGRKEICKGRYLSLRTSRLNLAYFAVEKRLLYHKVTQRKI